MYVYKENPLYQQCILKWKLTLLQNTIGKKYCLSENIFLMQCPRESTYSTIKLQNHHQQWSFNTEKFSFHNFPLQNVFTLYTLCFYNDIKYEYHVILKCPFIQIHSNSLLETCKQAQTLGCKSTCFKKCERIMQSGKIVM